jgi:hypothetical protein
MSSRGCPSSIEEELTKGEELTMEEELTMVEELGMEVESTIVSTATRTDRMRKTLLEARSRSVKITMQRWLAMPSHKEPYFSHSTMQTSSPIFHARGRPISDDPRSLQMGTSQLAGPQVFKLFTEDGDFSFGYVGSHPSASAAVTKENLELIDSLEQRLWHLTIKEIINQQEQ